MSRKTSLLYVIMIVSIVISILCFAGSFAIKVKSQQEFKVLDYKVDSLKKISKSLAVTNSALRETLKDSIIINISWINDYYYDRHHEYSSSLMETLLKDMLLNPTDYLDLKNEDLKIVFRFHSDVWIGDRNRYNADYVNMKLLRNSDFIFLRYGYMLYIDKVFPLQEYKYTRYRFDLGNKDFQDVKSDIKKALNIGSPKIDVNARCVFYSDSSKSEFYKHLKTTDLNSI